MSAGNHEVHAKEGEEGDHVELTLFHQILLTFHPPMRHEEGDECADAQYGLDDATHGCGDIHTPKSSGGCIATECGNEIEQGMSRQKDDGERGVVNAFLLLAVATHE